MRIVVTGASGNLGTALLRRLAAEGGHDVVAVSRRRPPDTAPYDTASWVAADLGEPGAADLLPPVMAGADAVVHLAWLLQPSHDRELMRRVNQDGTRRVADAARQAGVEHLVHVSSVGAYSPSSGVERVDESWPVQGVPTSPYSVDKAAAEHLLDAYDGDLVVTRVRPTLVLQDDAASEITRYFLGSLLPASLLVPAVRRLLPWPAPLALQFVHADDVAAAITTALAQRVAGGLNVAAEPVVDRDAYRRIVGGVGPAVPPRVLRAVASASWRLRVQPTDPGWLDLALAVPLLDTTRLRSLGWQPQHSGQKVLESFLAALQHRAGGRGPLLRPRRLARP